MSKVKANGFGVRFFRRGVARQADRGQQKGAADIALQDNAASKAAQSSAAAVDTKDGIIQSVARERLHLSQELTAPRDEKAAAPASDKEKALREAAKLGDCHKIRLLVMDGVDLDARDLSGRTALNIATQYSRQDAIKTILAAKEMRKMAERGSLPDTEFFRRFAKDKTGSDR